MNDGEVPQPVFVQKGEVRDVLSAQLFSQLTEKIEQ